MTTNVSNVPQAHGAIRAAAWGAGDLKVRFSGLDIFGKTLGIVGLGKIGTALARRVWSFDMRLLYADPERKPELEAELGLEYVSRATLLATADIVVIATPLNAATHGLIASSDLRTMNPDALLINPARGSIVDEAGLLQALTEGWIAGAGLDVFHAEPLPPGHPLLQLDNVVLTPHLGGSTRECDMVLVADALRMMRGLEPAHPLA